MPGILLTLRARKTREHDAQSLQGALFPARVTALKQRVSSPPPSPPPASVAAAAANMPGVVRGQCKPLGDSLLQPSTRATRSFNLQRVWCFAGRCPTAVCTARQDGAEARTEYESGTEYAAAGDRCRRSSYDYTAARVVAMMMCDDPFAIACGPYRNIWSLHSTHSNVHSTTQHTTLQKPVNNQ